VCDGREIVLFSFFISIFFLHPILECSKNLKSILLKLKSGAKWLAHGKKTAFYDISYGVRFIFNSAGAMLLQHPVLKYEHAFILPLHVNTFPFSFDRTQL